MKKFLLLSLFCFFVPHLSADECGYTQYELNKCAADEFKIYDAELNRLYKLQMSYLVTVEAKDALKSSQLAWIKYRDKVCEYEAPYHQGSMWSMELSSCKASHTKTRVKNFEYYISCRDAGCPY